MTYIIVSMDLYDEDDLTGTFFTLNDGRLFQTTRIADVVRAIHQATRLTESDVKAIGVPYK